jgi:hypothetical protein
MALYLHRADGTVELFAFPDETDNPEAEAFGDLVADYFRIDPFEHGAHLVVTLATGDFDVTGEWSLV